MSSDAFGFVGYGFVLAEGDIEDRVRAGEQAGFLRCPQCRAVFDPKKKAGRDFVHCPYDGTQLLKINTEFLTFEDLCAEDGVDGCTVRYLGCNNIYVVIVTDTEQYYMGGYYGVQPLDIDKPQAYERDINVFNTLVNWCAKYGFDCHSNKPNWLLCFSKGVC
jgi:hypothetical protein